MSATPHSRREVLRAGIYGAVSLLVIIGALGVTVLHVIPEPGLAQATATGIALFLCFMAIQRIRAAYRDSSIATRSLWDVLAHGPATGDGTDSRR